MKFKRPTRDQEQSVFNEYQSTHPAQRTGAFRKAYLKLAYREQTSEQTAVQMPLRQDISTSDTMILPSMQQPVQTSRREGQQVIHDTNKFDLRVLCLPRTLDAMLIDYHCLHNKYPFAIHLHPSSIEILRAWGLISGDGKKKEFIYKGLFTLRVDETLSKVDIVTDDYRCAS